MFVVLGITGQVGGATARHLLSDGRKVRAVVRDKSRAEAWADQGAELVSGDVSDKQSLADAFSGSEGAFVMTPPYMSSADPIAENATAVTAIVEAAHMSGLPRMVILSSIGSELDAGTGMILKTHELEQQTMKLGLPVAAIRAAWFMENFASAVGAAKEGGIVPSLVQHLDKPLPMIATEDIGTLAAMLLTERWSGKRILELEAPRAYSINDVAATFSQVLGKPVRAQAIPPEKQMGTLESFGMPPSVADAMIEMSAGFDSGLIRFTGAPAEHVRGTVELKTVIQQLATQQ